MASSRQIVTLAIVAVIALTVFNPISSTIADNSGEIEIENETWSATLGESHELDNYRIVEDSETVEWFNETSDSWEPLTKGDDYEIDYGPAEVTVLETNTAGVSDGDEVRASYTYEATDDMVSNVINIAPLLVALLVLVVLAKPVMEWG